MRPRVRALVWRGPLPAPARRWRGALIGLVVALLVAFGLVAAPFALAGEASVDSCADVQIIGARGTGDRAGMGFILGPIVWRLTHRLSGSVKSTPLDYPASADYLDSVAHGVRNLRAELADTATNCPQTRIVLLGYSQGADVVGDALSGPSAGEDTPTGNGPLAEVGHAAAGRPGRGLVRGAGTVDSRAADGTRQVAAVVLIGDPTFTSGEPFNVGGGTANGIFPRGRGALDAVADRAVSYCNVDDMICQGPAGNLAAHLDYVRVDDAAADFVVDRLTVSGRSG